MAPLRSFTPEPEERTRSPDDIQRGTFGALVRQYRRNAGWTQQELAEYARVGMRTISDIERDTGARPQRETVRLLADAFRLPSGERAAFEHTARHAMALAPSPRIAPPHNLPAPLTPLIGREDDLSAVVMLLRDADIRLVTVTGLGGVGKTRFALAVAAELRIAFPDGVWFVPLAALRDPALVLAMVAQILETPDIPGQPVRERIVGQIGARRMLLVLDNFEHVISAAVAAAALLTRCPGLKLLVTSRERLNLRGEHVYRLGPLGLPDAQGPGATTAVEDAPAIALFVQRARAADHTFALTADNRVIIAAMCARLDGLPLAIELAAARIAFMPPAALLARMERRLPLLTSGAHDLPERHQTLRNTIAWSDDLLATVERTVFRCLGVFAGGWTPEAAHAVCADARLSPDALFNALESLAAKSLIQLEPSDGTALRYGMLETIREYAMERLAEAGEEEVVRRAHAAYFLTVVTGVEASVFGSEHAAALRRLDPERENLRAALDGAITHDDAECAVRFGYELWRYWRDRMAHTEGRERLRAILALDGVAGNALEEVIHFAAGTLATDQRDDAAARASFEKALTIATMKGNEIVIANTLAQLGRLAQMRGDLATARTHLEESLARRRRLGQRWYIAVSLYLLGSVLVDQGETIAAHAALAEGLAIAQDLGSVTAIRDSRVYLGRLAIAEGAYAVARAHFTACLTVYRTAAVPYAVAVCVEHLARVALAEEMPERAAILLGAAVVLRERTGALHTTREATMAREWQAMAQAALGADVFAAAWQEGTGLTVEEAISLAIAPSPPD